MDLLLDEDGDLDITNGELTLTDGLVATAQRLSQKLGLFLGEHFLDRTRGVPWIQQVFQKNPNPVVIDAVIKREIITDPAVKELQAFTLDIDTVTRVMTVSFRAMTDDGPINFSEVFGI